MSNGSAVREQGVAREGEGWSCGACGPGRAGLGGSSSPGIAGWGLLLSIKLKQLSLPQLVLQPRSACEEIRNNQVLLFVTCCGGSQAHCQREWTANSRDSLQPFVLLLSTQRCLEDGLLCQQLSLQRKDSLLVAAEPEPNPEEFSPSPES